MATRSEASQHLIRQVLNIIAFVAFVLVVVLGVALPYNNNCLMDIIAKYSPDFMVPAYSWHIVHIVVFISLLCFVIFQAYGHRKNDRVIRSIDYLFWIFVLAHIGWTFGFFYDVQPLALTAMIIGAATAFLIYARLGIGVDKVTNTYYWCVHFPFSIIAAIALFTVIAQLEVFCIRYDLVWWGMGETGWNVVAMLVVSFFGSLFLQFRPDVGFGCTLVWMSASLAVYQNNQNMIVTAFAYLMTLYFAIITFSNGLHRPRISKRETK